MAEQHGKTLVPQIRFAGFTDPWEQRKLGELYQKNDERNTDGLGSERTLSVASMTFNSAGNGADDSSLPNYKRLRLGDIAFEGHTNKEFAYGRFVLNDAGNGIMSPRFTCLRPIVEQEYSFWKYFIHSEKVMRPILVNSTKSGTMMNELVVEDFLKQEILVPSLPEQRRIGAFFDRLDSLITLHQRKYDKLCVLKKSMLDKMFPKGGSLYPEIRFAGFTDPWEQRKLGELTESYSGGTPAAGESEFYGGSIPFIRSAEIAAESTELFLTEKGYESSSARMVKPGDVLYALYGATSGEVAVSRQKGAINQAILAILPRDDCDARYITAWLRKQKGYIVTTYLQGGQGNLSGVIVKNLEVFIPSLPEQQKIGFMLSHLDSLITLHQRKLELLRNIKKSMLDKMFV
ncbi:restriction endonuclease subunit S [Bifidobacterium adolescentis]|uniref:restriction endonuclease subunit S n=1 Tax=Bifidobacterium adolescentis TaxID=1680 RepID=UPI00321B1A37